MSGLTDLASQAQTAASACGVDLAAVAGPHEGRSPLNGEVISRLAWHEANQVDAMVTDSQAAYLGWRDVPAPARGQVVKRLGQLLTEHKSDLVVVVV